MRTLTALSCALLVLPVLAQRAPGAPTPGEVQAQVVPLQGEMTNNDDARRRIDAELRELERRASELRVEQRRLQNDYVRMQSEIRQQQQAR